MDFTNLTERTGVPRTTNSVTANDAGAFCVASAGKLAGVAAVLVHRTEAAAALLNCCQWDTAWRRQ